MRIGYSKQEVKDAPSVEADGELSQEEEARLYAHYGLDYSEPRSDTGPSTGDAMTRSEEELRVGTAKRERGRARLKKYVVTEEVTQTVPVQREEVRVEREPITDRNRDRATAGPDISEEEHEVVLHEEEVVATVSERLRTEQIDTEGVEKKGGKKRRQ